jgi:hypothetical protein
MTRKPKNGALRWSPSGAINFRRHSHETINAHTAQSKEVIETARIALT